MKLGCQMPNRARRERSEEGDDEWQKGFGRTKQSEEGDMSTCGHNRSAED